MSAVSELSKLALLATLMLLGCEPAAEQPATPTIYAQHRCGGLPSWSISGAESGELVTFNRLSIAEAKTDWNGVAIDRATLSDYLQQVRQLNPEPVTALVVKPHSSCTAVVAVRRMMEKHLLCSAERMCVEYSEPEWVKRRHRPFSG